MATKPPPGEGLQGGAAEGLDGEKKCQVSRWDLWHLELQLIGFVVPNGTFLASISL